jgi:hypothetical protein
MHFGSMNVLDAESRIDRSMTLHSAWVANAWPHLNSVGS